MYKYAISIGVLALAFFATFLFIQPAPPMTEESLVCTNDVKVCPDGSSVGRTGPTCSFAECPIVTTATTTAPATSVLVQARLGQEVSGLGIRLTPLEILEDSRCPIDVQCIQAGTVRIRTQMKSDGGQTSQEFKLNQTGTTDKENITLTEVLPVKKAGITIKNAEYLLTFKIAKRTNGVTGSGQVCTMEAKLCPDGSYVGRTGPNCAFAVCPVTTSGVSGTVQLGPTCPVMRDPPDPQCADKPYATTITVRKAGSSSIVTTGKSDANGAFQFSLTPGSYSLTAAGGTMLPRCAEVIVTVPLKAYATTTIYCDTGIR